MKPRKAVIPKRRSPAQATAKQAPPLVFEDIIDLDAFIAVVGDHVDAPAPVLGVAQQRALAALRASGIHWDIDDFRYPVVRDALNATNGALADLALICSSLSSCDTADPMTASDLGRLRGAAIVAYSWQAHARMPDSRKGGRARAEMLSCPPLSEEINGYLNRSQKMPPAKLWVDKVFSWTDEHGEKRTAKFKKSAIHARIAYERRKRSQKS